MIDIFCLDGIGGQGGPSAMCQNVARPLVESGRYRSFDVLYKASIGPVNPEHNVFNKVWLRESSIDGAHRAAEAIHPTDNIAGVIGYSGGADAASQLAEDMARGADYTRGLEIAWIVTIANPRRRRGPDAPGFGIAGEHKPFPSGITHFEIANPDDGICCCPEYSPLRTLTDAGQDGPNPVAWLRMIERGEWQGLLPEPPAEFSDPWFWTRPAAPLMAQQYAWLYAEAVQGWLSAGRYLRGYLDAGVGAHGKQYWEKHLFDLVVAQILANRKWR